MADKCVWTGASGRKYTFYVYAPHLRIIKGQMGGYIYAKINRDNAWLPIYIGQGDIGVRCTQSHHQIECIATSFRRLTRRCGVSRPARESAAYSITSSARASSVAGMSRPSALAVLRLMTSSNLVGNSTG